MLDVKALLAKILKCPMVIERGTSGIWTYRKWSDGTAECWGSIPSTAAVNRYYAPFYITQNAVPRMTYPFTFTAVSTVALRVKNGNAWLMSDNAATTTQTPTFYICRAASADTFNTSIECYTFGTWK